VVVKADEGEDADMSAYREFTGKTVEEALKEAREAFGAELNDLDFEILTPGSRGVLGMGAEPARIVAAPRSALGGAAPKREAAAAAPLPSAPREERDRGPRPEERDRGPRPEGRDRGPRPEGRDRGPRPEGRDRGPRPEGRDRGPRPEGRDRGPRRDDRPRGGDRERAPREEGAPAGERGGAALTASEQAEVAAARGSLAAERAELEAAEASPEALAAGKAILEQLMTHLGFEVRVEVDAGETSRLNVVGDGDEKEALGALIGRKGERLSALQHLVNLMLSKEIGTWTRVLVDVEDYRGRRERQLRDLAQRAAARVTETGKMLQLEPMPALERRWVHLTLRDHPQVATQSIGEEPSRRVVLVPRDLG
jgi:spoIIIJ-associated protein